MQFRLQTLFLFFVAIWSSMAAFGVAGIAVTCACLGVVTFCRVNWTRFQGMTCGEIVVLLVGVLLLVGLLLPTVSPSRTTSRPAWCMNNMKQIGLALHHYHEAHGAFPPAYVADTDGTPMHSWRVLILPYMENMPLYKHYDFDEPWDGPNNRKLADIRVPTYVCPYDDRDEPLTSYVAVTGPNTVWPGAESISISDIHDGTANTILLAEIPDSDIHWMEPRDLSLDDAMSSDPDSWRNRGPHGFKRGYFVIEEGTRPSGNVLLADCTTTYVTHPFSEEVRRFFEINDGKFTPSLDALRTGDRTRSRKYIHWGHCIGLVVWILSMLVLLTRPLPRAWVGTPPPGAGSEDFREEEPRLTEERR